MFKRNSTGKSAIFNHSAIRIIFIVVVTFLLSGCLKQQPSKTGNICKIFTEYGDWYDAAKSMNKKWNVPINVPMAIMYQESSFMYDAAPPMKYYGIIPIGRASNAYGYAQAKNMTWNDYKRETGNIYARRDDFVAAIDFIGWFVTKTHKSNKVSKHDAYGQYLNYHEGWGGYRRHNYNKKPWLVKVAKRVDKRSKKYAKQLKGCRQKLELSWFERSLYWFGIK